MRLPDRWPLLSPRHQQKAVIHRVRTGCAKKCQITRDVPIKAHYKQWLRPGPPRLSDTGLMGVRIKKTGYFQGSPFSLGETTASFPRTLASPCHSESLNYVNQIININQIQTLELSLAAGTTGTGHARAATARRAYLWRPTACISLSHRLCAEPAGCVQNPPHHALEALTLPLASSQATSNTRQHSFL